MEIWTLERKEQAYQTFNVWHGTPHADHIAVVGMGIDCAKLVNEILIGSQIVQRIELMDYNTVDGQHNQSHRLAKAIERLLHVEQVSKDGARFGDIFVDRTGEQSGHCGIVEGDYVWHSLAGRGVTRNQFRLWRHKIEFVYRITETGFKSVDTANL